MLTLDVVTTLLVAGLEIRIETEELLVGTVGTLTGVPASEPPPPQAASIRALIAMIDNQKCGTCVSLS